MNDCMPWPVLDFYALALLDTCVLCITLPAVKKGLAFCCIDWTRYTPALTSSTGAILLVYHIEPSISMQGSKHI